MRNAVFGYLRMYIIWTLIAGDIFISRFDRTSYKTGCHVYSLSTANTLFHVAIQEHKRRFVFRDDVGGGGDVWVSVDRFLSSQEFAACLTVQSTRRRKIFTFGDRLTSPLIYPAVTYQLYSDVVVQSTEHAQAPCSFNSRAGRERTTITIAETILLCFDTPQRSPLSYDPGDRSSP